MTNVCEGLASLALLSTVETSRQDGKCLCILSHSPTEFI